MNMEKPLSEQIKLASLEEWNYIPGDWIDEAKILEDAVVVMRNQLKELDSLFAEAITINDQPKLEAMAILLKSGTKLGEFKRRLNEAAKESSCKVSGGEF